MCVCSPVEGCTLCWLADCYSFIIYCTVCRSLGLAGCQQAVAAFVCHFAFGLDWVFLVINGDCWVAEDGLCFVVGTAENLVQPYESAHSTSREELVPVDAKYSGLLVTSWLCSKCLLLLMT